MKRCCLFIPVALFVFFVLPSFVFAVTNSGFIPGQIWYSKDTLVEGDTVNIHTAVWNGDKNPLSAKVEFYDKNVILGSRDVTLVSLELKDVFIPWKITSGDHTISAKIISSLSTISGKKETVSLIRNATSVDKQFISVVVKNENGVPVSNTDVLDNEINKTSSEISSFIPEQISVPISNSFAFVDSFRDKTSTQLNIAKDETQKEIDTLNNNGEKIIIKNSIQKSSIEEATKKPITYIKLFLFTTLSFIFNNKIVFYGILILVTFFILRFIYRRISNR
jgi:hypothetical protein